MFRSREGEDCILMPLPVRTLTTLSASEKCGFFQSVSVKKAVFSCDSHILVLFTVVNLTYKSCLHSLVFCIILVQKPKCWIFFVPVRELLELIDHFHIPGLQFQHLITLKSAC